MAAIYRFDISGAIQHEIPPQSQLTPPATRRKGTHELARHKFYALAGPSWPALPPRAAIEEGNLHVTFYLETPW